MEKRKAPQVGYRKPPLATRFRPGTSGNPRGRPKRPRDLADDLAKELARIVTKFVNGKTIKISTQRALIRKLIELGLEGDRGAGQGLLQLARELCEPESSNQPGSFFDEATEAMINAEVERRFAEQRSKPHTSMTDQGDDNAQA